MLIPVELPRWVRVQDGMDLGTLRRQLVLLTGALAALVAVALIGMVQVVLAGSASDSVRQVLADRAALVAGSVAVGADGRLTVPAAVLDPGVALYDDGGRLVAGQIPASLSDVFADLSAAGGSTEREGGEGFQVLAEPFSASGGTARDRGVVVVAERLAPYESAELEALGVSLAAGVLIVVLAMALAAWASRRALRPVAEMARVAEHWSDRDLDRRFDLGEPTDEIRALGHTLDGLLERVATAILAEQRLTSELAHELRTPLTAARATVELVEMRDDLDDELREDLADVRTACAEMSQTITGLLDLARAQSTSAGPASAELATVVERLAHVAGASAVVTVAVPSHLRVAAPPELVRRALGPIVDNAARLAERVHVAAVVEARAVRVVVTDDGPGVDGTLAAHLFEPGRTSGAGSGLGLALARRVARSVGGDVRLLADDDRPGDRPGALPGPLPGAAFEVTLPVA